MTMRILCFLVCLSATALSACDDGDPSDAIAQDAAATDSSDAEVRADVADATWAADANSEPDGVDMDGASPDTDDTSTESPVPFAELQAQGVFRYLGAGWAPTATVEGQSGEISHIFEDPDGPRCFTGEDFFVSTRDGSGGDLMIFLQGGGVCGPGNCEATESWPMLIPPFGILDPTDESNAAANFDVGYVPYCDGSLFIGDAEHDIDGDGTLDRSFRGLLNLSASLEFIAQRYPSPSRIVLVGNSAGGMAVHFAIPLVRTLYPDVSIIDVINDSGVGLSEPGVFEGLAAYWNAETVFPASCDACISEEGHLTGYHAWLLREDADIRLGYLSARQDERIVGSLPDTSGEQYDAALVAATATLKDEFGARFNSMIIDGSDHTFVLRDFARTVADTSVREWIGALLANDGGWVSVAE